MSNLSHSDLHQDIARSAYADMVHDDERNRAYCEAIRLNVSFLVNSKKHNPNGKRFFNCCDIGTGSGLLSMMVARAFLELDYKLFHIKAFECFKPMALCAKQVIACNSFSDYITVIPERAELTKEDDKFDLLVAELLDTELIGEGCLEVYRYAIENLCSPSCLFIPHKARIYIEPIASDLLFKRHAINDLKFLLDEGRKVNVQIDEDIKKCPGLPAIDDMQVSALKEEADFKRFSEPKVVFEFTFNDITTLQPDKSAEVTFPVKRKIEQPPVIVMWWDIVMCDESIDLGGGDMDTNVLSCAPVWARTEAQLRHDQMIRELYGRDVWREHWIQGIYYLPEIEACRKLVGMKSSKKSDYYNLITIYAFHDSHSLWFSLEPQDSVSGRPPIPPTCTCGVHRNLNRYQIAFLNCEESIEKMLYATLYDYGGFNDVLHGRLQFRQGPRDHQCSNNLADAAPNWRILFEDIPGELDNDQRETCSVVDLSLQDDTCWEKIMLRFIRVYYVRPYSDPPNPNPSIIESFQIKCTQVHFDNLCRIKMNVEKCEGFNMCHLDKMLNHSSSLIDDAVESHHLWEYRSKRIDVDYVVFDSKNTDGQKLSRMTIGTDWIHLKLPSRYPAEWLKKGWALVFWADFKLQATGDTISTGPVEECKINEYITWDRLTQQKVHFLHDYPLINDAGLQATVIDLDVSLSREGEIKVQRAVDYNIPPKSTEYMDFVD